MVKIKTKKQFTKKELVRHLLEQEGVEVEFDDCDFNFEDKTTTITPAITGNYNITFNHIDKCLEVLVEEEITEETKVPQLLEIYSYTGRDSINACVYNDESIAEERDVDSISFHMLNPDGTLTLLWTEEGGMVE